MKNLKYILLSASVAFSLFSFSAVGAEKHKKNHGESHKYEHRSEHNSHRGGWSGDKHDKKDKGGKKHGDKHDKHNPVSIFSHGNHHNPPHHNHKDHHKKGHKDNFNKMLRHAVGGGKGAVVWQVGPFEYIVKYKKGKNHYMRRFYTNTGKYGPVSRIILAGPNEWYLASDRNRRYRSNGSILNVFVNGKPLSPWSLVPDVDINISFP